MALEVPRRSVLRDLDFLNYRMRRTSHGGRLSPVLRREAEAVARRAAEVYPDLVDEARRFYEVSRTGNLANTQRASFVLRNEIRRRVRPEPEFFALRTRISQLEGENETLRDMVEAVSRDKQENAVKKFEAAKNRVFVIMPFDHDFDDVWLGAIRQASEDGGFASLRVDQVSLSSWITDDVEEFIDKSNTIIADITGSNPNVMFELGFALAKGKDAIIISQHRETDKVPFDISGIRRIEYQNSWQGVEDLARKIKGYLQSTLEIQKQRKTKKSKS
jgi:hypothetical protein